VHLWFQISFAASYRSYHVRLISYQKILRLSLRLSDASRLLSGSQRQSPTAGDPPAVLAPPAALARLCATFNDNYSTGHDIKRHRNQLPWTI